MSLPSNQPNAQHPEESHSKSGKDILKEVSFLGLSNYLTQFLHVLRGLIIARTLTPATYGVWNLLKMFIFSAEYFSFGATEGMSLQIPLNKGKNLSSLNKDIEETVLGWGFLLTCIAALAALGLSFSKTFIPHQTEVILSIVAFVCMYPIYFAKERFFSNDQILFLAKFQFALTLVNFIFGVGFLLPWGLRGLIIGQIVSHSILLIFLFSKKLLRVPGRIHWRTLPVLIRIGFPMALTYFAYDIMQNIDMILIAYFLGKTQTGYYGLVAFVTSSVHTIPTSISNTLFPKMVCKYGETNERKAIENYFVWPMKILSYLIPILLGLIFLNIEWPIVYILPQYTPAITTFKILFISLIFSVYTRPPKDILLTFKKQTRLLQILGLSIVTGTVLDVVAIKMGFGIEGVAVATATTFFISSIILIGYALYILRKSFGAICQTIIFLYTPFVYSLLVLFLICSFVHSKNQFLEVLLRTGSFLLLTSPLMFKLISLRKRIDTLQSD